VDDVRVLLVSTYELGHQPLHVASPAGALLGAGHDVRAVDLAVDGLDTETLDWSQAVAVSVPMHTALRLALNLCRGIRAEHPELPLCLYGLYAPVAARTGDERGAGGEGAVDLLIGGEYEGPLVSWVDSLAGGPRPGGEGRVVLSLGRGRFGLPARHLLPSLDRYARLAVDGEERLAGYVEASHGCAHRCRHCPVPVTYDGRTRLVSVESVVADVAQLVELGARHITFGDPDFLNGPHHCRRVVEAVHSAFPATTFDVTVKVEHILRHASMWPRLAEAGLLFVVSAFEGAEDRVLRLLDKGHTVADEMEAVAVLRRSGVEPRPSFMPFTPWTTAVDVRALLDLVARCDLIGNVDPVQYAIRLLVPPGSLLLASGALEGRLGPYDDDGLSWSWRSPDPRLDALQQELSALAVRAAAEGWPADASYDAARHTVALALDDRGAWEVPGVKRGLAGARPAGARPRLTEAWFCCAEPTDAQFGAVALDLVPLGGN
jgi:radical SAM superfamily enzyme YgiQ (UPF0313 family)